MNTNNDDQNDEKDNDEYISGHVDSPTAPTTTTFDNMELSPTPTTDIITTEYHSNNNTNNASITDNNTDDEDNTHRHTQIIIILPFVQ